MDRVRTATPERTVSRMADVTVSVTMQKAIESQFAAQLCDDFLEWLDDNGIEVAPRPGYKGSHADMSFHDLAHTFAAERAT